ncbi:MAG: hypothetical protein ACI4Q4_09540, partial [Oscillospiraceae bacterium]
MHFRKIIAGMTAAVILATSTVSALAETPSYDLPLMTAAEASAPLAVLNAGETFRVSVSKILGDRASELAKAVIDLDGTGEGSINWAGAGDAQQEFAAADGAVTLENTEFVSAESGFDGIEIYVSEDSVNLNSIEFFDENGETIFTYSADSFSGFTESTVLLDQPVAIDNWDTNAAVSARTLREAGTAVAGTSYLKVDFSEVTENGGCMLSVFGFGDAWRWSSYNGAGSCYVAVTENMLTRGMGVRAVNTQIDKITVVNPADFEPVANEYTYSSTLFEGSTTLYSPESEDEAAPVISIDPVGAKAGDIISVTIDTAQTNDGSINFMDGEWNNLQDARFGDNFINVSGNLDTVELMLDEQGAEQLNRKGLVLCGSGNVTVTKVELLSKSAIGAADTPLAELYCDPDSMQEGDEYPNFTFRPEQYLGDRISDVATVEVYVESESETLEGAVGWGNWESMAYADGDFTSAGVWSVSPSFEKGKNLDFVIEDRSGSIIVKKIVLKDSSDNVLLEYTSNYFYGYVNSGSLDISGTIDWDNSKAVSAKDLSAIHDLKAGVSFLEITVESTGGCIYASTVGNWDFASEWFDTNNDPKHNKYYRVITQDMLDRGIMINGDSAVSITSVNVINPEGEEFSPKEYPVHEMLVSEPIECFEWENENGDTEATVVFLPLIKAQVGDILRFNIDITDPDEFFINVKDANEWDGLSDSILDENGTACLIPSLNSFDVHIGESDLDVLRYSGAAFNARGVTLESVELLGQDGTCLVRNLADLYCDPAEMGDGDEFPAYWFHPEQYVDDITDVATIEVYADSDSETFEGAIGWGVWGEITYAEDTFTTKGAWQVTPTLEKGKNHNLVIEDRNGHLLIEKIVMKDAEGSVIFEYAPGCFDGYAEGGSLDISGAVDWDGSIAVSAKDLSAIHDLKAGVS